MENKQISEKQIDHNPWSGLLGPIGMGMLLQLIGLNFLMLEVILPSIGIFLIYVGIRDLKQENKWFRMAWYFTVGTLLIWGMMVIFLATPLAISLTEGGRMTFIGFLSLLKAFGLVGILLATREGIQTFFRGKELEQPALILTWFAVWIVTVNLGAYLLYAGGGMGENWIVVIVVFTGYVAFGIAVIQHGAWLDKTGCFPAYKPKRISARLLGTGYLTGLAILIVCTLIVLNHPTIQGEKVTFSAGSEVRAELVQKGMPQEIVDVISDETVGILEGVSDIRIKEETLGTAAEQLLVTSVYFQVSEEIVYMLEYFRWPHRKAIWNDGVVVWGDGKLTLLDSKLVFDRNGETYFAKLLRYERGEAQMESMRGSMSIQGMAGGVSFPFDTENHRGYVFVKLTNQERTPEYVEFLYGHFKTPIRYPFDYAENMILNDRKLPLIHYAIFVD